MKLALTVLLVLSLAIRAQSAADKDKLSPPEADEAAKAKLAVKEVFAKDIDKAKTASAKRAMATKLLMVANDPTESGPNRWVIYGFAAELAAAGGDAATAMQAVNDQDKAFRMATHEVAADMVDKLATHPASFSKPLVDFVSFHAEQALEADDYKSAIRLLTAGFSLAKSFKKDSASERRFEFRLRAVQELTKEIDAAKGDDEATGRVLCFRQGAWKRGLALLAKAKDEALAAVAKKDIADPKLEMERSELGDAWFDLAEKATGRDQQGMYRRGYYWYGLALVDLAGLQKFKIEQKMKKAVDAGAIADSERVTFRTATVGGDGGEIFEEIAPARAKLVGFVIHFLTNNGAKYLHAIQPIYLDADGKRFRGKAFGTQTGDETIVEARAGYVISGIVAHGGNRINGLRFKFQSIPANAKKSYDSPWLGGPGEKETTLEAPGKKLIGIFGRCGSDVDSLGLIFWD
jgi:hypothetical protein